MIKLWAAALSVTPLAGWVGNVLAQAAPSDTTTTLVTALAGSSPFAGLAMYVIMGGRNDLRQIQAEKNELIKNLMERVIPGQMESNRLHAEVVKALEAATINAQEMATRGFDPSVSAEILHQLKRLRARG